MSTTMGKETDVDTVYLTDEQKRLIEETWALVYADAGKHGLELMLRIFKHIPHAQGYFEKFKEKREMELKESDALHYHAGKMMCGFNRLICNIRDGESLKSEIKTLAADHKTRGVTSSDFKNALTLFQTLLKEELGEIHDEHSQRAWKVCCDLICREVESQMGSC